MPQAHGTSEEQAPSNDEVLSIKTILTTLPVKARVASELHGFGGWNVKEIARYLGVSVAGAYRLIKTSLAAITKEMQ